MNIARVEKNDKKPFNIHKIVREQFADFFIQAATQSVRQLHAEYCIDQYGLHVRHIMITGSTQTVLPYSLGRIVLYFSHRPLITGHPRQRRKEDFLWRENYCAHMSNGVYDTVDKCESCPRINLCCNTKRLLREPSPSVSLEFTAMHIVSLLIPTTNENKHLAVIMDRNIKMTRPTPTSKTIFSPEANVFFYHWLIPHGILKYLLTNNKPQFFTNFFVITHTIL